MLVSVRWHNNSSIVCIPNPKAQVITGDGQGQSMMIQWQPLLAKWPKCTPLATLNLNSTVFTSLVGCLMSWLKKSKDSQGLKTTNQRVPLFWSCGPDVLCVTLSDLTPVGRTGNQTRISDLDDLTCHSQSFSDSEISWRLYLNESP